MLGKPPVVDQEAGKEVREVAQLDGFEQAHGELTSDRSIQFELQPFRPEPPLFEFPDLSWLADLAPALRILFWVMVALIAGWLLYLIVGRLTGLDFGRLRKKSGGIAEEPDCRAAEQPARRLLSEADALAAQGLYSEAAHLLLFRSIEEIEQHRPQSVRKAYTSRDIARLPTLPAGPAEAFAGIVRAVERSLFGGRALGLGEWQDCRASYERFAFAGGWRG